MTTPELESHEKFDKWWSESNPNAFRSRYDISEYAWQSRQPEIDALKAEVESLKEAQPSIRRFARLDRVASLEAEVERLRNVATALLNAYNRGMPSNSAIFHELMVKLDAAMADKGE